MPQTKPTAPSLGRNAEKTIEQRTRKQLIVHDSVALVSLVFVTVALFLLTLLLFHSFTAHRGDLAHRWADRGHAALDNHQPAQAIASYRAALSYAPGERGDELMLARALGEAGRTEESFNYFTELWELHPGDGFINLQLARLAARKLDVLDAINFYRASLYGTWDGDGVERRRTIRLELARYLIAQKEFAPARAELLVAGGNNADTAELDLTLATLLEQAQAPADALDFYRKTLAHNPHSATALSAAGRLGFEAGDYSAAYRLLNRATRESPQDAGSAALLVQTERILQLTPSSTLTDIERTNRILMLRTIARQRLAACSVPLQLPSTLQDRWNAQEGTARRATLLHDPHLQAAALQLVYDTELAAASGNVQSSCPPATDDDALLLLLARSTAHEEASHR